MNRALLFLPILCIAASGQCAAVPPRPPATVKPILAPMKPAAAPAMPARQLPAAAPLARPLPQRHPRAKSAHFRASLVLGRIGTATAAATAEPALQGFVNAVQVYPYVEGIVFHVYTAPGQITDIALEPGESLGAVASGDTVRWVIGDTSSGAGETKRSHILVKPFTTGLATNLVITTDRRSYHLALTSTAHVAMAALSWHYPQDDLIALRKIADQQAAVAPVASGLALESLNFDYALTGDIPRWRPLRVFDDGRQTFVEFPASLAVGEAPPLFVVDGKGEAQLVNYRVQGRFYVVDRLFDRAELRLGTKHQEVVHITRAAAAGDSARRRGA